VLPFIGTQDFENKHDGVMPWLCVSVKCHNSDTQAK